MLETMHLAGGVGLAAPQVNVSRMLFIIDWSALEGKFDQVKDKGVVVYINPVIHSVGNETLKEEEGCLSLPGINAEVERSDELEISYQTLEGEEIKEEYEDYPVRIILHEFDHLQGVLFIDRITKRE